MKAHGYNRKSVSGIILSTERALDWHHFGRTATSMGVAHKEGPGEHSASLSRTTPALVWGPLCGSLENPLWGSQCPREGLYVKLGGLRRRSKGEFGV